MDNQTMLEFNVGIYGRMQLEMRELDLVDENGVPRPTKHMSAREQDAVAVYNHLSYKVRGIDSKKLHELAQRTNDIAKSLVNEETLINNYLLAMMLMRSYLQDLAPKSEQIMVFPKINRMIDMYENLEGEEYAKIRKTTFRVADNMWRVFTGKAQLSDEIRDLRAKKFIRSVA